TAAGVPPRGKRKVQEPSARDRPLAPGERLSRGVYQVKQVGELLPGKRQQHLPGRPADEVWLADEGPEGGVRRHDRVLGSLRGSHQRGHLLEAVLHGLGVTGLPAQVLLVSLVITTHAAPVSLLAAVVYRLRGPVTPPA